MNMGVHHGLIVLVLILKLCGGNLDSELEIICKEGGTLDTIQSVDKIQEGYTSIKVDSCPPPQVSYAASFRALNINVSSLTWLKLINTSELLVDHLAGLNLSRMDFSTKRISYLAFYPTDAKTNWSGYKGVLQIYCENHIFENSSIILPNIPKHIHYLIVNHCSLPHDSYATELRKMNFEVEGVTIFSLQLSGEGTLTPKHFTGLNIETLNFFSYTKYREINCKEILDDNFLEPFERTLTELTVNFDFLLPPLPAATRVVNVSLENGRSVGLWGGCEELQRLKLQRWVVPVVSANGAGGWLAHCPQLEEVELRQLQQQAVQWVLAGARALVKLTVSECLLNDIATNVVDASLLRQLTIVHCNVDVIDSNAFKAQTQLEMLNLSNNRIHNLGSFLGVLKPLRLLRSFTFDFNNGQKNYQWREANNKENSLLKLENVSLRQSNVEELFFDSSSKFSYLNLSNNNIVALEFLKLPDPRSGHLVVDLRNNPIREIPVTEEDYQEMIHRFIKAKDITILMNMAVPLKCDCSDAWLARALRLLTGMIVTDVRCAGGKLLHDVSVEQLECNKDRCANCTCRHAWRDNTTSADCRGMELDAVPRRTDVQTLLVSRNRIETLYVSDFPKTLLYVDLSFNMISHVTSDVVASLFAESKRRVRMAGNPLVCDCNNQPLLRALQTQKSQVEDYDDLTCIYNTERVILHSVAIDTLCDTPIVVVASVTLAFLIALVALAASLYYRYKLTIKMFLYARGYCLCCVREDELDIDRPYDTFISFAHEDEEVVEQELLPVLDQDYKVCIHTRDWMPGELINTQILNSVEQSRRTLIVLSRNFVDSIWGMTEFRTAYMSAMLEGRVRVIIVVLDDVLDDKDLDPDLRSYIRTYTYVKYKDKWFWQKLRYALPHRRDDLSEPVIRSGLGTKLQNDGDSAYSYKFECR